MRTTAQRYWTQVAWVALTLAISAQPARAEVGSDQAAAIVIYPYVTADSAQSADTFLQLSNTSTEAVVVQCFYEGGPQGTTVDFQFQLTPRQPIAWRVSAGLSNFPLDGVNRTGPGGAFNANSRIPPLPDDPYVGDLRCIAVDANLVPAERNVLIGTATIEHRRSPNDAALDAAQYNAIGVQAHAGAGNGDNTLVLGGTNAEYDGCPNLNVIAHFFDGALDPVGQMSSVSTTLILVPCSQNLLTQVPGEAVVMYDLYNEFEQHFQTQKVMHSQQVSTLSTIDVADPTRSIFNVLVSGTLTGQTRIQVESGSGVLALAIETHSDVGDPTRMTRAAFNAHLVGTRDQADTFVVLGGAAPAGTPTPTASSTATSVPTRVATATPTVTPTRSATRTAEPTNTAGGPPTNTATKTATIRPTTTPSATQAAPSATATAGNNDDGCSITSGSRHTAATSLVLLGPALLLLAARRARRK